MPAHKTQRLSIIIGAYLFGATMLFSLGLLAWTYQSSIRAMDREVLSSFDQSYAIARSVLEHRGDLLGISLNRIASEKQVQSGMFTNQREKTEERLKTLIAGGVDSYLDVLLVVLPDNSIWADAGSPFFALSSFYPDLAREQHALLTGSRILSFTTQGRNTALLLKSAPIVHDYTGKVMGTLVGGVVLNDNYSLLESIRTRVHATSVTLLGPGELVGTTELMDSGTPRAIIEAVGKTPPNRSEDPRIMRLPPDLIALAMPLDFNRHHTDLTLIIAVSDHPFAQLRQAFLVKAAAMSGAAVLFFLLTILLIRRLTMPSLTRLLTYSETVRTTDADTHFQPGPIMEFNRLGSAVEDMVADLNRSRRYADDILNSMPFVLIGVNGDNTVTHWNTRAAETTGIPSDKAKGRPLSEVFPRLDRRKELIAEAMENNDPRTATKIPFHINGTMRYENITVYPLSSATGAVILVEDITDRTRIDEVMVQTEKMMSVGGLAAGMAHEINNPLGIILQGAQGIERRMNPSIKGNIPTAEELHLDLETVRNYMSRRGVLQYVRGIREAGERAAGIVRNMLEFSRKSESRMAPSDIGSIIDRTLDLAAADYDLKTNYDFKRIRINKNYSPDLPELPLTRTEMEQVILNIVKNAAQAMANKVYTDDEPTIDISTTLENNMVRVDIRDNGPGMDDTVRKRIFEPFYTTKPVGAGTGLGLSVSYFIVTQNHSGEFLVQSTPGQGTIFTLLLPTTR